MTQTNLGQTEIGTIEPEKQKLMPAKVKIVNYEIKAIEKARADKAIFEVKHPDKEETIHISAVAYLESKQVTTAGTWLNLDKENKIYKGSALAVLLKKLEAKNLDETKGKECDTEMDDNSYLCFKAY